MIFQKNRHGFNGISGACEFHRIFLKRFTKLGLCNIDSEVMFVVKKRQTKQETFVIWFKDCEWWWILFTQANPPPHNKNTAYAERLNKFFRGSWNLNQYRGVFRRKQYSHCPIKLVVSWNLMFCVEICAEFCVKHQLCENYSVVTVPVMWINSWIFTPVVVKKNDVIVSFVVIFLEVYSLDIYQ